MNLSNNRFNSGQGYTYDLNGNVISDAEGKTFIYDGENKQKQVKNPSNVVIGTYYYDGNGKRVKKVTSSEIRLFIYNTAGELISEYSTLTPQSTPVTRYITNDHLGSPRVITNQSGAVLSRRDFMPFGEEAFIGVGNRANGHDYTYGDSTRQKFTGYERDEESNLDFGQARYYSSSLGRFFSVDPENAGAKIFDSQSWNGYTYVRGNPLVYTDPDGMEYKYCNLQGQCVTLTDKEVRKLRKSDKFAWSGSRDGKEQLESGVVKDSNGNVVATFQQTSHDDQIQGMLKGFSYIGKPWIPIIELVMPTPLPAGGAIVAVIKAVRIGNKIRKAGQILVKVCCFVAETPVSTKDGFKPIENIEIGDFVLSYNEKTNRNEYKPVINVFTRYEEKILLISVEREDDPLGVTPEHPFYIRGKHGRGYWTVAELVRSGDKIRLASGKWSTVEKIRKQKKGAETYNFEVADNHNYFVGETKLLVHNTCKWIPVVKAAAKAADDVLQAAKKSGIGKGARSGQHGRPHARAAEQLKRWMKKEGDGWLPQFKSTIERKIREYSAKARGINHK